MKKATFLRIAVAAVLVIAVVIFFARDKITETFGGGINNSLSFGGRSGTEPAAQVYAVNTTSAVRGEIRDYLSLSGNIIASSTVDAYSDAAGKVSKILISVGNRVARGDRIAEIDPSRPGMEFVASYVTAPVGGTVVALPAQVGMTISQAVPIARIAGGTGLEIQLYVAERFISKIALNQRCEISLDAYPGDVFRGTIREISPTIDVASRTMEIRVAVENTGSRLKAGMFAKVRIITEQKNNIVKIPSSALIQRFGEEYIYVAQKDSAGAYTARKQPVVPGIIIDGIMEIRQGLNPDEDVIVRGQSLLDDGAKINIVDRVPPLSAN